MRELFCLEVARTRVGFKCPTPLADNFQRTYGTFASAQSPDLTLDVSTVPTPEVPPEGTPHHGQLTDHEMRITYGGLFNVSADLQSGLGELCYGLTPSGDTDRFPEGIQGGLSALFALLLAHRGHALVHACGLTLEGRGVLCPGISGTGKSTLSKMFEDHEVLNDEFVGVTREDGGWLLHSTPFWGNARRPDRKVSTPLSTILKLVQSPEPRFVEVPRPARIRHMMATVALPVSDSETNNRVFGTASDLTEVNWSGFEFPRSNAQVARLVREHVGA